MNKQLDFSDSDVANFIDEATSAILHRESQEEYNLGNVNPDADKYREIVRMFSKLRNNVKEKLINNEDVNLSVDVTVKITELNKEPRVIYMNIETINVINADDIIIS